jgi:hypothetical protein
MKMLKGGAAVLVLAAIGMMIGCKGPSMCMDGAKKAESVESKHTRLWKAGAERLCYKQQLFDARHLYG